MVAFADGSHRVYADGRYTYVDKYRLLKDWPARNIINDPDKFSNAMVRINERVYQFVH